MLWLYIRIYNQMTNEALNIKTFKIDHHVLVSLGQLLGL